MMKKAYLLLAFIAMTNLNAANSENNLEVYVVRGMTEDAIINNIVIDLVRDQFNITKEAEADILNFLHSGDMDRKYTLPLAEADLEKLSTDSTATDAAAATAGAAEELNSTDSNAAAAAGAAAELDPRNEDPRRRTIKCHSKQEVINLLEELKKSHSESPLAQALAYLTTLKQVAQAIKTIKNEGLNSLVFSEETAIPANEIIARIKDEAGLTDEIQQKILNFLTSGDTTQRYDAPLASATIEEKSIECHSKQDVSDLLAKLTTAHADSDPFGFAEELARTTVMIQVHEAMRSILERTS